MRADEKPKYYTAVVRNGGAICRNENLDTVRWASARWYARYRKYHLFVDIYTDKMRLSGTVYYAGGCACWDGRRCKGVPINTENGKLKE